MVGGSRRLWPRADLLHEHPAALSLHRLGLMAPGRAPDAAPETGCPDTGRLERLEHRWWRLVDSFSESVAVYDLPAARQAAGILVPVEGSGRPMFLADAQIAGICLAGGRKLATRNVSDFAGAQG